MGSSDVPVRSVRCFQVPKTATQLHAAEFFWCRSLFAKEWPNAPENRGAIPSGTRDRCARGSQCWSDAACSRRRSVSSSAALIDVPVSNVSIMHQTRADRTMRGPFGIGRGGTILAHAPLADLRGDGRNPVLVRVRRRGHCVTSASSHPFAAPQSPSRVSRCSLARCARPKSSR